MKTGPIFVLGTSPRSGTNFLHDLLCLHPDCHAPGPIWEDGLVHHSASLLDYASAVHRDWKSSWGLNGLHDDLCRSLGNGLVEFLQSRIPDGRLVTKTPSVRHLENFFRLFPAAHLLVLVRDGRNVVASGMKSFDWDFEAAVRGWGGAATTIRRFEEQHRGTDVRYLIVRYEDLWRNQRDELRKILSFLSLDEDRYDFEASERLPVRGSSVFGRRQGAPVDWDAVERTPDFNPLHRWSDWSRARHERFAWLAGSSLRQLGYDDERSGSSSLGRSLWNTLLDLVYHGRRAVRAGTFAMRRAVGLSTDQRWPATLRGAPE